MIEDVISTAESLVACNMDHLYSNCFKEFDHVLHAALVDYVVCLARFGFKVMVVQV